MGRKDAVAVWTWKDAHRVEWAVAVYPRPRSDETDDTETIWWWVVVKDENDNEFGFRTETDRGSIPSTSQIAAGIIERFSGLAIALVWASPRPLADREDVDTPSDNG